MLRINRLRVEINTVKGVYGIDESFKDGLNFTAMELKLEQFTEILNQKVKTITS